MFFSEQARRVQPAVLLNYSCVCVSTHGAVLRQFNLTKKHIDVIYLVPHSSHLTQPWSQNLIKYFHSSLIVDATFSIENLRFISCVVIDGEWQTQVVGLIIRGTEDTKGYSLLFKFVSEVIGNTNITIMADMARCIQKAARKFYIL